MNYHIYTDGGSRGNPGPGAIGVVIAKENEDEPVYQGKSFVGSHVTNNEAEYLALLAALREVRHLHPDKVICYLDSELVVKQLNNEYKVKSPYLKALFQEVQSFRKDLPVLEFRHIKRGKNKLADQLVNEVLDGIENS